jgi:hypothetical protein
MSFLDERVAAARAVPEVRRCGVRCARSPSPRPSAQPPSHNPLAALRLWAAWVPPALLPRSRRPPRLLTPLRASPQAERSPEAAAFIEMYELAAEAQAFQARNPNRPAGPIEWDRFWTPCFLRLARCYLWAPAGLRGGAGGFTFEREAVLQLLKTCMIFYGNGVLGGPSAGFVPAFSRAVGRLLGDGGLGPGVLARVAVAAQLENLDAELLNVVVARLRQPGARAGMEAQLAAAQAGQPPARRLAYDELLALLAAAAMQWGRFHARAGAPTRASLAAFRCGGDKAGRAQCGSSSAPAFCVFCSGVRLLCRNRDRDRLRANMATGRPPCTQGRRGAPAAAGPRRALCAAGPRPGPRRQRDAAGARGPARRRRRRKAPPQLAF